MRKLIIAVLAAMLISIGVFAAVQSIQPDRAEAHFVTCYPTPDVGQRPFYGTLYYFRVDTICSGVVPMIYSSAQVFNPWGGTVGTYAKFCPVTAICHLVSNISLYPGVYAIRLTTYYWDDGQRWGPYYNYWQFYVRLDGTVAGPFVGPW